MLQKNFIKFSEVGEFSSNGKIDRSGKWWKTMLNCWYMFIGLFEMFSAFLTSYLKVIRLMLHKKSKHFDLASHFDLSSPASTTLRSNFPI